MGHEMLLIWTVRVGMLIIAIVMGICIYVINFPYKCIRTFGLPAKGRSFGKIDPHVNEWEVLYINSDGDTLNRCKHCPAETWS
ncbi:MAG TPA: hypothetical protein VMW50_03550 [Dehalococcoidia bacterium]|nr:hypothetical protein [Dehalococcoidia bacterium]